MLCIRHRSLGIPKHVVFIGSPGAGKSSLLNSLIAKSAFTTGMLHDTQKSTSTEWYLERSKWGTVRKWGDPPSLDHQVKTAKEIKATKKTSSTRASTFQAYGIEQSSQDPVAEAFAKMLEHIQQSENRLDQLQDAMCKLDPDFCKKDYDKLCLKDLDVIGDSDMDAADAEEK